MGSTSQAVARANALAVQKHWFHWFIEFPDVFERGGFDCILGNPPYLGDKQLSGSYGHNFCEWVRCEYAPTGLSDLVVYFLRRIYDLLLPRGFVSLITTNSIKDGDVRVDGLEQAMKQGGNLVFAVGGTRWPGVANLTVSLFSMHKGSWTSKNRMLDGREVSFISAFFEDYADQGAPYVLASNDDRMFNGYHFLGDGFMLTHEEAAELIRLNHKLKDVIFRALNGDDLNSDPEQAPRRSIINFFDWPQSKAEQYREAFERVRELVKPVREMQNRAANRERWWVYAENRPGMRRSLVGLKRCFVTSRHSKHLIFAAQPAEIAFTNALNVFTTARWCDYVVVQSTIHEVWARKYSGALETRLRYSPTDCFLTYSFPASMSSSVESNLEQIGERYHEHRRELMLKLQLGLTKTYNLFHDRELSVELVAKESKQPVPVAESAHADLLQLRKLHVRMDQAVLAAYGWHQPSDAGPAIALRHDFYEGDYLPENDRVRYTIHPDARKELLKRLLQLNHKLYAEEEAKGLHKKKPATKSAAPVTVGGELPLGLDLFGRPAETAPSIRQFPTTKRVPHKPLVYSIQLLRALLAETPGGMPWPRLVDAYTLATRPELMRDKASAADHKLLDPWAKSWNENPALGGLVDGIENLGSGNLAAEKVGGVWVLSLQDGPKLVQSEHVAYDAWLALRVLGPAPETPVTKTLLNIVEFDDWTQKMERVLVD